MGLDDQYEITNDPYVDPNTGVLRNLLGITDAVELEKADHDFSYALMADLLEGQPYRLVQISFAVLRDVHRRLFQDLYAWAGELRTIEVSKGNTRFAFSQYLDTLGSDIFVHLADEGWLRGLERSRLIGRLAYYYSELNILHPFREGNGRAIRTLLSLLAQQLGWIINWDDMTAEENIEATSFAYANDAVFKLFTLDVGLLGAIGRVPVETLLSPDALFREFRGALAEQLVCQELVAAGLEPFYFARDDSRGEIDFLVQAANDIVPIEVKAGTNLAARSLTNFVAKNGLDHAAKLSLLPYRASSPVMTNLPLYWASRAAELAVAASAHADPEPTR